MLQISNMLKTIEIFFISPTGKHYLMEISRKIGLAHTSVKKNLDYLMKKGLLIKTIEKKGTRKFPVYQANLMSKVFKTYKSLYNIASLRESGLVEFLEDTIAPKAIVLFGSYQRGEDTEESDIDLFIECKTEKIDLKAFEKKLQRKIQLHFNKDFTSYPTELKNNIINGIVVSGYLEGYQ